MKATTNTQQQLVRTGHEVAVEGIGGEDPILDSRELEDDMNGQNIPLAQSAWTLCVELKMLADLRCEAERIKIDQAWKNVLSRKRIQYDIDGPECERRRTAARVLAELEVWRRRRAAVNGELTRAEEIKTELRRRHLMRRLQRWETMGTMTS